MRSEYFPETRRSVALRARAPGSAAGCASNSHGKSGRMQKAREAYTLLSYILPIEIIAKWALANMLGRHALGRYTIDAAFQPQHRFLERRKLTHGRLCSSGNPR